VGRSLPAEISEFLVNALESHDDGLKWYVGGKGRLEREEKRMVSEEEGGHSWISQAVSTYGYVFVWKRKKRKKKKEGESGRAGV
jgi:hypothetical protein